MADRSPASWLELLERRLHDRWAEWQIFDNYYEGDQNFSRWLRSVQRAFQGTVLGNLLNDLKDNYMPLVVDSVAERMKVQGFRVVGAEKTDDQAAVIWRENGLKSQSNMVHTEAIKLGEAYWMVTPSGSEDQLPLVTAEHPSQVIVATAPGNRRKRLAALKKWVDDDGNTYANVYLPGGVHKYVKVKERTTVTDLAIDQKKTEWRAIGFTSNPLEEVPIVPVPNNPSMLRGGRSDLSFGAVSLQNLITKTVADLAIGAEYHGLPQRVILGVEPPRDPTTGRVIADSEMQKERIWYLNSPDAKAHEFSQADLTALRDSVDGFIGDLAAQTRIPIYYFRPAAISNISAEALIGLDAGLVSKGKDKEDPFEEGHNEMMRLSFKALGRTDSVETLWANTESRSYAQIVDAATKKQAIGVPWEQNMSDIGYTPDDIDRMAGMREADALLAETLPDATEPTVPPAN